MVTWASLRTRRPAHDTSSWASPVTTWLLVLLAAASLGRVYNGPLLIEMVGVATGVAVLISATLRRAPAWLAAALSVIGLAVATVTAVQISARAGGISGDLTALTLDAARNAIPRLLTAVIPVEAQPDTVLAPVALAWLAGFAATELAGRARRPAAALIPPALLYAGVLVLVGPNAPVNIAQPLLFAVVAAVGLAIADLALPATGDRRLRLRMAGGLALGLVAVIAGAVAIAPLAAGWVRRDPVDPRRYVTPPSLDALDANPLSRLSGWAADPSRPLFDVTVLRGLTPSDTSSTDPSGEPSTEDAVDSANELDAQPLDEQPPDNSDPATAAYDARLRLAVLADWDGITWHMRADYRNAGRVLPPPDRPPGDDPLGERPSIRTIEERITATGLAGRLLPAVASPQRVDGVRVAFDTSTGTLLHSNRVEPGLTYVVTSANPSIAVDLLPAADVPAGPAVARFLGVGDSVPDDLGRLAEQIAAGEGSPYLKAQALEMFLSEHYRLSADAPSGHAYPNLRFFLFTSPRAGGQQGTSEQFATAFATLGRLMGLPTRVVVGFRTPVGGGTVTAGAALAWPEVLFAGVGWVPFDPLPRPDVPPRPLEDEYLPKPAPPTNPPASVEPSDIPTYSPPTASAAPPLLAAESGAGPLVGWLVAAVALLAVLVFVIGVARARRRRSHLARGTPQQRILGAWSEILDALTLAGVAPPAHLTSAEIAVHAATVIEAQPTPKHVRVSRPAAPSLAPIAEVVNMVAFGGDGAAGPARPGQMAVDEGGARVVSQCVTAYVRMLRATQPWWRRLFWHIDPRPLVRGR